MTIGFEEILESSSLQYPAMVQGYDYMHVRQCGEAMGYIELMKMGLSSNKSMAVWISFPASRLYAVSPIWGRFGYWQTRLVVMKR